MCVRARAGRGAHPTRRHTTATHARGGAPHTLSWACALLLHTTHPFRARHRSQNPSFGSLLAAPRTPITDANTRCFSAPPHRPCAVCLSARALKSAVFAWAHGWSARSGLCGMGRATALCWARAAPEACPATRTHHDATSAGGLLGMQGGGTGRVEATCVRIARSCTHGVGLSALHSR